MFHTLIITVEYTNMIFAHLFRYSSIEVFKSELETCCLPHSNIRGTFIGTPTSFSAVAKPVNRVPESQI
jgi:hypothetical protein